MESWEISSMSSDQKGVQEVKIVAGKWCPRCQQYLSRELFYRNKAQFDGLAPYCKVCLNGYMQVVWD